VTLSAGGFSEERSTCGFLAETAPMRAAISATSAPAFLRAIAAAGSPSLLGLSTGLLAGSGEEKASWCLDNGVVWDGSEEEHGLPGNMYR
jgi:hypothetical protein